MHTIPLLYREVKFSKPKRSCWRLDAELLQNPDGKLKLKSEHCEYSFKINKSPITFWKADKAYFKGWQGIF